MPTHARPSLFQKIARATLALAMLLAAAFPASAQIGGLDPTFAPGAILNGAAPGEIRAVTVLADNSVIIAGAFTSVGGVARGNLAKLTATGALDGSFASGAGANGAINAVIQRGDGTLMVGGEFTTYDGTARGRLARVNASGNLDAAFNPGTGCDGPVYALSNSSPNVYVGGDFTMYNGTSRGRLVSVSATGALNSGFATGTGANAAVRCIVQNSSGVWVGGDFTTWNGSPRARVAKFSVGAGTLDSFFNTSGGPNGPVLALGFSSAATTNTIFLAGDFTSVSGTPRARLAGVSQTATGAALVDNTYTPSADGIVRVLAPGGSTPTGFQYLLPGGDFTSIDAFARGGFARLVPVLPSSGTRYYELDAAYHTGSGANAPVLAIQIVPDGKMIVAGRFSALGGTSLAAPIARLYGSAGASPPAAPTGVTATAASDSQIVLRWTNATNASNHRIERSPDGTSGWTSLGTGTIPFISGNLAAGTTYFYRIVGSNTNGDGPPSATVSATTFATPWTGAGGLDPASAARAGTDGTVSAIVVQGDGKIVIGGLFSTVHGVARNNLARLNANWTLDTSFDPGIGVGGSVYALALDGERIVVAGFFSYYAGAARENIARVLPSGAVDPAFDPGLGTDSPVLAVAVQPGGAVVIGGNFNEVGGLPRSSLARLHPNGAVDTTFQTGVDSQVSELAVQRDGRVLLGGFFNALNGASRRYLARLLAGGAPDTAFNAFAGPDGNITALAALGDGRILIAGAFTNLHGTARHSLARLNADGSLDPAFAGLGANTSSITCLAPQPDGKVVIGGAFLDLLSTQRLRIARMNADGTLDTTFHPGVGANGTVNAVAIGPDTGIILGGAFTQVAGIAQGGIARLLGDGNAAAPVAPAGLTVTAASTTALNLAWNDVAGEYSWTLERSPDGVSGWVEITTLPWDVTTHTDAGRSAATTYHYRLRAVNSAGASPYSAMASGTTWTLYQQWKVDAGFAFAAPDDGDSDGDGIGLLMEYALALDPAQASTDGLPVGQILDTVVALSYRRFRPELLYTVEVSTDLAAWTASGVTQGSGPFPIAFTPRAGAPQKFLRLRVTQP